MAPMIAFCRTVGEMRLRMKRLGLLVVGGITMTVLLLMMPNQIDKLSTNRLDAGPVPKIRTADLELKKKAEIVNPDGPSDHELVESLRKKLEQYERTREQTQAGYPPQQEAFQKKDTEGAFKPDLTGRKVNQTLIVALETAIAPWKEIDTIPQECPHEETLGEYWVRKKNDVWPSADSWDRFHSQISTCDMYREKSVELKELLHDMATLPVKKTEIMDGGTQVKLLITFENDKQAVFKPMRFNRHYETDPNHFYFSDFERHHAELASYHLDKVLGIRHTVPLVGRVFNVASELLDKADKALAKTFFISPVGNHCFVGKCDYYCDTTHAICGSPPGPNGLKEGSLQVFLPDDEEVERSHNRSPYRRTYSKKQQLAQWQWDLSYCRTKVKRQAAFAHGRRLLDLVELYIFDFLTGNQDRHHFETFEVFEEYQSFVLFLDNGRSFGRPRYDDMTILAPLTQCCIIRPNLLKTLLNFYSGPQTLSEALYASMQEDPVAPILSPKHYPALERRLEIIMQTLYHCLEKKKMDASEVIMTEYHNPLVPEGAGDTETDGDDDDEEPSPKIHRAKNKLQRVVNQVQAVKGRPMRRRSYIPQVKKAAVHR